MLGPDGGEITTPHGLPGFDWARSWVWERSAPEAVFGVLRNTDRPGVGLLVAEPWELAPGYEPDLPAAELSSIGIVEPHQAVVLVVATIAADRSAVWLRLAAPIAGRDMPPEIAASTSVFDNLTLSFVTDEQPTQFAVRVEAKGMPDVAKLVKIAAQFDDARRSRIVEARRQIEAARADAARADAEIRSLRERQAEVEAPASKPAPAPK